LIERVGADQLLLSNELEKLALYDNKITQQTIDLLTTESLQSTTFQLLEAAFAKKPKLATKLYDQQRLQKIEPQAILGLLAWQLQALAIVIEAGNRSVSEIAASSSLKPYTINKTKAIARGMNRAKIKQLIDKLVEIDRLHKTQSINLDAALTGYIIELAS
jgi:DNA polymerase III delta subunit